MQTIRKATFVVVAAVAVIAGWTGSVGARTVGIEPMDNPVPIVGIEPMDNPIGR